MGLDVCPRVLLARCCPSHQAMMVSWCALPAVSGEVLLPIVDLWLAPRLIMLSSRLPCPPGRGSSRLASPLYSPLMQSKAGTVLCHSTR